MYNLCPLLAPPNSLGNNCCKEVSLPQVHCLEFSPESRTSDDPVALLNSLNKSLNRKKKKKDPDTYHDFQAIISNDLFDFMPKVSLLRSLSSPSEVLWDMPCTHTLQFTERYAQPRSFREGLAAQLWRVWLQTATSHVHLQDLLQLFHPGSWPAGQLTSQGLSQVGS